MKDVKCCLDHDAEEFKHDSSFLVDIQFILLGKYYDIKKRYKIMFHDIILEKGLLI